jgi:folate-binding protein YgfZ
MASVADQYRIVAAGAGWVGRADRGRLRFEGKDRSSFLQGLFTNDVHTLQAGQGIYATYLTAQGRMLTDTRLYHCADYLLAQVPAALAATLADRFDQLVFAEDVRVRDVSAHIAQVSVMGPDAARLLARALAIESHEATRLATLPPLAHLAASGAIVARSDELDILCFDVFVESDARDRLAARLEELGVVASSFDLFDALRVDAGRPVYGQDMGPETIPLEAGLLDRAISTTKGCYVGQEIVIRMLHRGGGRVARRLARLRFDDALGSAPTAGTPLVDDGREVGRVTSVVVSPVSGHLIGLGYVHRDHAEAGTVLTVQAGDGTRRAEIVGFAS